MNILFVSDLGSFGGGETSLFNLMYEFNNNYDEYNIIPMLMSKIDGKLVAKSSEQGIENIVIDFKAPFKRVKIAKIYETIKIIKRFIRENNIKIIQCNEWSTAILFSTLNNLFRTKCRIIWVCHGQWYKFNNIKRKLINNRINLIIAVSNSVRDNLYKNKINKSIISTQPLGIDIEKFKNGNGSKIRKESGTENGETLLGTIGRFQPIKGQKLIVEVAKLLKEECFNFKIIMVGDCIYDSKADLEYKSEVLALIKEYKLEDYIMLLGEREDIPDILNALDVLMIPSINESFGMVVIEAFAAGCPVISTPCDGPKEIITNDSLGIIITKRDKIKLKDAIINLFQDNNKKELIKRCISIENEKYNIKFVCNKYNDMYKSLFC